MHCFVIHRICQSLQLALFAKRIKTKWAYINYSNTIVVTICTILFYTAHQNIHCKSKHFEIPVLHSCTRTQLSSRTLHTKCKGNIRATFEFFTIRDFCRSIYIILQILFLILKNTGDKIFENSTICWCGNQGDTNCNLCLSVPTKIKEGSHLCDQ